MASAPDPVREGEAPVDATRRRRSTYWAKPAREFQPTSTEQSARELALDELIAAPLSRAPPGGEQLVEHRIVDDPDLDLAIGDAGDRDAKMRHPAGKVRGAVDRIDNPHRPAGARGARLALLADEPIAWKDPKEALGDERLGLAVDLGQKVLRTLERDRERTVEKPAPRRRASLARDRLRRKQSRVHERRLGFGHSDGLQKWL